MTERKSFHIIGRPKPVAPAPVPLPPIEKNDIVRHLKTGVHYRIMRAYAVGRKRECLRARRVILMDEVCDGYRNWRWDSAHSTTVTVASTNLVKVQRA